MRVKDIMTRIVLSIPEGTSVETAARMMRDHNVGMLPVGDKDLVTGVVTDRDITIRVAAEARYPRHTAVREIMSGSPVYCFDDQDIEDACFMMEEKHVRRLLVFDRRRELVGLLSLDDIATRTRQERLVGYALSKVARAAA
jgi:CBS domain-containing protein